MVLLLGLTYYIDNAGGKKVAKYISNFGFFFQNFMFPGEKKERSDKVCMVGDSGIILHPGKTISNHLLILLNNEHI